METVAKKQEAGKTKSSEAQDLRDLFEVGLKDIYQIIEMNPYPENPDVC